MDRTSTNDEMLAQQQQQQHRQQQHRHRQHEPDDAATATVSTMIMNALDSEEIVVAGAKTIPVMSTKHNDDEVDVDDLVETNIQRQPPHGKQKVNNNNNSDNFRPPINPYWTQWTDRFIHYWIPQVVTRIALIAIRRPRFTLCGIAALSLTLIVVGYNTNYKLDVDQFKAFAPFGVRPKQHQDWIENTDGAAGFPPNDVIFVQLLHANGNNVLGILEIRKAFEAYNLIRSLEGYEELCQQTNYQYTSPNSNSYNYKDGTTTTTTTTTTCQVSSVLRFWDYNQSLFESQVQNDDPDYIMQMISRENYPDGTPVDHGSILGNHQQQQVHNNNGTTTRMITSAQSLATAFLFPDVGEDVDAFEEVALEATLSLRKEWEQQQQQQQQEQPIVGLSSPLLQLEVTSPTSYAMEFTRAIEKDIPLVPLAFVIMSLTTCFIFYKKHPVESRSLLGLGAVVTIVMSLLSGYGLCFLFGIPLTNLTTLTPFVVFGIGLDDSFLITGAFLSRTNPNHQSMEERVQQTTKDVGLSVSVTTMTTTVAFALGAISNIPAVRWLCLYAMVTILIDFFYQITFFMALLVLDEKRIQDNRSAYCVCFRVKQRSSSVATATEKHNHEDSDEEPKHHEVTTAAGAASGDGDRPTVPTTNQPSSSFIDRMMVWYADHLLHPVVKAIVFVAFTTLFCLCAYSSTKLTQEFKVTELVPSDSYVISFMDALDEYTTRSLPIYIYFRHVDQADREIQQQMIQFVEDLSALEQFGDPAFCWVRDFQSVLASSSSSDGQIGSEMTGQEFLHGLTFNEQLSIALSNPTVKEVYGNDIVLDNEGNIKSSRCRIFAENLDLDSVDDQVGLLHDQERVSASQPINQGRKDWAFFSHDYFYLTWEFYDAVVEEFIFTAIVGVIAITVIGGVCIPHWTGSAFVLPMIGVLYVDLIGIIQAAGLHINVVTHVAMAMSIGLLVDYIIHVLLRYYESSHFQTREEKVKDTLRCVGAAVLCSGLSTLLGVLPLALSTSEVMRTVFVCFVAMVTLGCGHGLILLPVLLSVMGPETTPITAGVEKNLPWQVDGDDLVPGVTAVATLGEESSERQAQHETSLKQSERARELSVESTQADNHRPALHSEVSV